MIIKSFELNKIKANNHNMILFYGKNEGLKSEAIDSIFRNKDNIINYDEKEILENPDILFNKIFSKSLFEDEKVIIIKRATDKIIKIIENIENKNFEDLKIIIDSDNLEKRSKLRSYFEKNKNLVCTAFYPDNEQILSKLAYNFLKERNIILSQSNINGVVTKCNGDRKNLFSELNKIDFYTKNGKKISTEVLAKLTNLSENHSISELIDNCLAKNKNKTLKILNENNFNNEDCILILRTFLNKSKKILILSDNYKNNKNLDLTISTAKPPIFWKDKEITKLQLLEWSPKNLKELIYKLNKLELIVKRNLGNAVSIVTDFILDQTIKKTSN